MEQKISSILKELKIPRTEIKIYEVIYYLNDRNLKNEYKISIEIKSLITGIKETIFYKVIKTKRKTESLVLKDNPELLIEAIQSIIKYSSNICNKFEEYDPKNPLFNIKEITITEL